MDNNNKEQQFMKEAIYFILVAEQNKKPIKKEEITGLISKTGIKKTYKECFKKIQKTLDDIFRMMLIDISHGDCAQKKYILINILPFEKRLSLKPFFTDEFHWIAMTAVCLISLSGGEIEQDQFIRYLKSITKKDDIDNIIKTLEDRTYIFKKTKSESSDTLANTQTMFVAAQRTLFEFTAENIFSYIKKIGLDYFDCEDLLLISGSINSGFEKMCEDIKKRVGKTFSLQEKT